jgi:predicted DsbA family dithiol-disulfide isomerase/uncharacterized membrane protein
VIALAASAALFVDYTAITPSFCGAGSGCAAVRASGFGYAPFAGIYLPVPAFGLLGFAVLLGVSLTPAAKRWLPIVAALGGVTALSLLAVQAAVIGRFCALCVTADSAGLLAALFGILMWQSRDSGNADEFGLRWGAWPALGALAILAPLAWPRVRPAAAIPDGVARLYAPGKINVVEFADYECPFCRALHPLLKSVIASYPGKVNFTRLNLPLQSHEFARVAARAQVCAREQGKGDALADLLFRAEDLRADADRVLAESIGTNLAQYDECLASGKADKLIDQESKILLDAGFEGLPTTFVGAQTIIGLRSEEVFRDAFDRAERGDGGHGIPWRVYILGLALALGAVIWVGRPRRATLRYGTE